MKEGVGERERERGRERVRERGRETGGGGERENRESLFFWLNASLSCSLFSEFFARELVHVEPSIESLEGIGQGENSQGSGPEGDNSQGSGPEGDNSQGNPRVYTHA